MRLMKRLPAACEAIDMAGHNMPAQFVPDFERTFKVQAVTFSPHIGRCFGQRFG